MATASPPRPPEDSPLPGEDSLPAGRVRSSSPGFTRPLAMGSLAVVVLIVAYLIFAGGGATSYKLLFNEANQLVRGDQVQVGGVPVGSIKNIVLTHDFKALVTIEVDSSLTPLHEGTTAQVRVPSLTSVANRYIALTPGPNMINGHPNRALPAGATLPVTVTKGVVDLDQLFNIFNPQTRKALQQVLQGSAEQYAGAGHDFSLSVKYFSPSLAASDHLFAELVQRPGDVDELPRGIRQGDHHDRRARPSAERPDRKREHDLQCGGRTPVEPGPELAPAAPAPCATATARLRTCRPRSAH